MEAAERDAAEEEEDAERLQRAADDVPGYREHSGGDEGDGGTCSVVQRQREMREMKVRVLWYRDSRR